MAALAPSAPASQAGIPASRAGAAAAGAAWPAVLLVLMVQLEPGSLLGLALMGNGEIFAYELMFLALAWIESPRRSAVVLALAVGSNQLAWMVAGGYALLVMRFPDWTVRLKWFMATLAVTLIPWLVIYPDAVGSTIHLLTQPYFPIGIGIINLARVGLMPYPSPTVMLGVMVAGTLAVLGWCFIKVRWRAALPVLSLAGMWLSWRSGGHYIAQIPTLAVAMAIGMERLRFHGLRCPALSTVLQPGELTPARPPT